MPFSNRSRKSRCPCHRRPRRIGGSPRHRPFRLYPDSSGDGGGIAPVEVTGRVDRIREPPRLSDRRLAGGHTPASWIPPILVVGFIGCQRRDDGHDGTGVLDARLPGSALYRRGGQCLCAGPGVSPGARPVGVGRASEVVTSSFRRCRGRDRGFRAHCIRFAGTGRRLARPMVCRGSRCAMRAGTGGMAGAAGD